MVKSKLVCGVGINDADYVVCPIINGKRITCSIYGTWCGMLKRCYDKNRLKIDPTYQGCTVCAEWLRFSNFKEWMERQNWSGKQLDKDILSTDDRIYSPDTCAFIDARLNLFLTDRAAARGDWPIGVYFNALCGKFVARCRNPFSRKLEHLGYFNCPKQAHLAWKNKKHQHACVFADMQENSRVANALRLRYL